MGRLADLATDTELEQTGDGIFAARVSPDWSVWGPLGGYLAAIALRAAGRVATLPRPASISVQFLGTASIDALKVAVRPMKRSRRAESLHVSVEQAGRPVLSAHVWAQPEGIAGPTAQWGTPPDIPPPAALPTLEDAVAAEGGLVLPCWLTCVEIRLAGTHGEGLDRPAREPRVAGWTRLRAPGRYADDPWLDACRVLVAVDLVHFPAVAQGFPARDLTFVAPSLDLYVAFHAPLAGEEWLLLEARGTAAGGGLLAARADVWTADARLVATSGQQMVVRETGGAGIREQGAES
jgi:acyl-CoA thioesterase